MTVMKQIGQVAVKLKKELVGFALNRMQYALLNECWRLISVTDSLTFVIPTFESHNGQYEYMYIHVFSYQTLIY